MIINPKIAIEKGWITKPVLKDQIQPNSIDLRLEKAYGLDYRHSEFSISKEDEKKKPKKEDWLEISSKNNWYTFFGPRFYNLHFNESVTLPNNVCAFITHRSSLNRYGCFILTGIYDSGFKNQTGATLYAMDTIKVEKGARIATIYFMLAESSRLYTGKYNNERLL